MSGIEEKLEKELKKCTSDYFFKKRNGEEIKH